jgi:hypothetical protein
MAIRQDYSGAAKSDTVQPYDVLALLFSLMQTNQQSMELRLK